MVHEEVNPLEERHMALSARFKAAWALHQLLSGMQRMNPGEDSANLAETFQALYARLKAFSESLRGHSTGHDTLTPELARLEREVGDLCGALVDQEEGVSPSDLRKFLTQVRTLDDRILIEVVRFYFELQQGQEWPQERLDKIDFLLSRLAERIAGPDLQGDRVRLDKVLQGLQSSVGPVEIADKEIADFTEALEGLRSDVRWVKTFDELNESSLLEVFRALKGDMAGRMFHRRVLPVVIEVNNAFRRKIEELSKREERRLLDDYQKLSQLQMDSPQEEALESELAELQRQFEEFRERAKSNNVRIGELMTLGQALSAMADRVEVRARQTPAGKGPSPVAGPTQWIGLAGQPRMSLVPDLESLQPHWSELLQGLSGLGGEFSVSQAASDNSLASFRLEVREVAAFQRTVGSEPANVGLEQFILAGAALRRRVCADVAELRDLHSRAPGGIPEAAWREAREGARLADAYVRHYAHLSEQAVFDGQLEDARDYQILQHRMSRELAGLVLLLSRLSSQVARSDSDSPSESTESAGPFGEVA